MGMVGNGTLRQEWRLTIKDDAHVKINLGVGWERLKKKEIARNGSDETRVTEIGPVFASVGQTGKKN